jgi:RNA polymerase primary sigma factor
VTFYSIAYWPNAVEVVLQEYNDFLTGERRLADILSGYLDPETDDDIPEVLEEEEELDEEDSSTNQPKM